jgi:hypothetical protein
MFQHLSVHEPIERGHEHLAQADQRVDTEDGAGSGLQAVHGSDRNIGAAFELGLAPTRSLAQHPDTPAYSAGDFAVALSQEPVRPPGAAFALLRLGHRLEAAHCETPEQEGQVFSHA